MLWRLSGVDQLAKPQFVPQKVSMKLQRAFERWHLKLVCQSIVILRRHAHFTPRSKSVIKYDQIIIELLHLRFGSQKQCVPKLRKGKVEK
jgi:hypothetical protein